MRSKLAGAIAGALLLTAPIAQAALGDSIFALNGDSDVVLTFEGNFGASFTNILFLNAGSLSVADIFNNQTTPVNATHNLGRLGSDELVFGIMVYPDGLAGELEAIYLSGPGSRNPDGVPHALVEDIGDNVLRVSFEDLPGPGGNYADLVFLVSHSMAAPVPEPETWATMLAGLGLIGAAALRRRRARLV